MAGRVGGGMGRNGGRDGRRVGGGVEEWEEG